MKRQGNNSGSSEPHPKVVRLPPRPSNGAIAAVSRNEQSSNCAGAIAAVSRNEQSLNAAGAISAVSRNEPNSTVVRLPPRPLNCAGAIAAISQNEQNSTVVSVVKLPSRILNAAGAISAVSRNEKLSTGAGAIVVISQNEQNSTCVILSSKPLTGAGAIARLSEMYLTLRQGSTPLANIMQIIDTAFEQVISGDPLNVWDRMMQLISELQKNSDKLLEVSDFLLDLSKVSLIKGHMTALSSLCEQCRKKDGLQTLRSSLYSKVNMLNRQHGIPFWTITSALTWEDFSHYFQSLGLGNLADEYYDIFMACFRAAP